MLIAFHLLRLNPKAIMLTYKALGDLALGYSSHPCYFHSGHIAALLFFNILGHLPLLGVDLVSSAWPVELQGTIVPFLQNLGLKLHRSGALSDHLT